MASLLFIIPNKHDSTAAHANSCLIYKFLSYKTSSPTVHPMLALPKITLLEDSLLILVLFSPAILGTVSVSFPKSTKYTNPS